ncbi:PH domain-containing protein [Frankia sp. QA3]|uniref:PH domain-containing protein n=1 Tax=Frankia sp. QA3 TaxID=710111 RepID=UPI0002E40E2F|nr:PH domain-containing protein [Frankia sp. QA3]
MASGGRAAGRYKLTDIRLYATQGITTTTTEQYELGWLFDIDVRQTLIQRARGVGDVVVHVRRGWGQDTVILQSVPEPMKIRDLLNQVSAQARQQPRSW